jgi:hypothetical protein
MNVLCSWLSITMAQEAYKMYNNVALAKCKSVGGNIYYRKAMYVLF